VPNFFEEGNAPSSETFARSGRECDDRVIDGGTTGRYR